MPQKTIFGQASVQRVFGSGCHSASRDGQEGVLAMAAASPPDLTSLARPIPNGSKLSATEGDRDALFWLCSNAGGRDPEREGVVANAGLVLYGRAQPRYGTRDQSRQRRCVAKCMVPRTTQLHLPVPEPVPGWPLSSESRWGWRTHTVAPS